MATLSRRGRVAAVAATLALAAALILVIAGSDRPGSTASDAARPVRPSRYLPPPDSPAARKAHDGVARWLAEHPPSAELHQRLLATAELADQVRDGDRATGGDAAAHAARREERRSAQRELREHMRGALREMGPAGRARMRELHLNVIQLARHVTGGPHS